ncbi:MAG TPA: glycosyltransferase [Chitinivibrionales bacterium]|nr:glycosyltransferase [Chitinivibrionales bacterium]
MIGLWRLWPKRGPLWAVFLLAVAFRAALLPFPANSDVNRYIWEGKVQNAGYNPYALAPDSPRLAALRDFTWKGVNHKSVPAGYGPVAELLFRLCAARTTSPFFFKIIFTLFDLGVMLFLALLMRTWSMEPGHLLLYALNPLVLYAIAGEGHLESVMLFWIAGSFYFFRKQNHILTFLFFGLACATKLTPVFLFPFLLRRNNVAWSILALAPIGLYGLYLAPGLSFLSVPLQFATMFHFNGFAATILSWFMPFSLVPVFCLALLIVVMLYLFFFTPDRLRAAFYAAGAFFLVSTTAHPWYLLLATILLPFYQSRPWILLHLTVGFAALVNIGYVETGVWKESSLLWAAEYIPFALLSLWGFFRGASFAPAQYPPPSFLSIVIPTLNERENIVACINAIVPCEALCHEVIVADGGSADGTRDVLRNLPAVRVVTSAQGRGIQIRQGIAAARGDVILVLHADSRPDKTLISRLATVLGKNPHVSGGAFRARYQSARSRYTLTSLLNNGRTMLTGISFGDQAQFFRTAAIGDRFPAYKIMEDVELSFLMKERGSVAFLPCSIGNSVRKWERDGYVRNFVIVLWLNLKYVLQRRFGLVSSDCEDYYVRYYQGKQGLQWQAQLPYAAQ